MAQEARRYRERTGQPDQEQARPAGQEPTLPAYHEHAATWERPSDAMAAAVDQAAQEELDRQYGRGTPEAEGPNRWDFETMDAAQAAAVAGGTWQQPSAPAQSSAYPQSYQGYQAQGYTGGYQQPQSQGYTGSYSQGYPGGHQQPQSQGYTGGLTFSPQQAAYFAQQVAQPQPYSADPAPVDDLTRVAYERAQALSAVDFPLQPTQPDVAQPQADPGARSPSPNQGQGQYQPPQSPPTNPFAGPANDSLAQFDPHAAMSAPLRDSDAPGLHRSSARRLTGQARPQGRRARGGSSGG